MSPELARVFLEATISIFAIVNPIGNLPIFIGLTDELGGGQRRKLLRLAGLSALAIILTMAVAGRFLLHYVFHIDVPEFMFGGGLILIVVGVRNIIVPTRSGSSAGVPISELERMRIAITPIAFPLLVGPGTIVTVLLIVNQNGIPFGLAACLAAFVFVLLVLEAAELVYRLLGKLVALAVGRIMDIFIVAIGVNFLFRAVKQVFPMLGGAQ